jgi:glyoxylase-like metal-dependent hydrolase (beta-lactamase superfamily II)
MSPILLPAHNPSPWTGPTGNNTYFLPGARPALIDAGVGQQAHVDAIEQALGGADLAMIIVTHGHKDHVDGLPALLERWPSAEVVRHPAALESVSLRAGDGTLRPLHTPGHSPDHMCLFDEATGDLYCGDLMRLGGTIVIPASKGGHLGRYLDSLRLVRELSPRRALPGHGQIIDDPSALIAQYLRHRHEREQQVIACLRGDARTPDAIAARLYGALAPEIVPAAVDSVLAHLIKLEEEGRATRSEGVWRMG